MTRDPVTVVDIEIALWMQKHEQPAITAFMAAVSNFHTWPLALIACAFFAYLLWKRVWRWAVIVTCAVPGAMVLNTVVKLLVHRQRPTVSGLSATLTTYSFPSGHTIGTTIVYGVIALYVAANAKSWRTRIAVLWGAGFVVGIVALSRMYLGVHYLSDILAGAVEGIAWLALCHTAVTTLWVRRHLSGKGERVRRGK